MHEYRPQNAQIHIADAPAIGARFHIKDIMCYT